MASRSAAEIDGCSQFTVTTWIFSGPIFARSASRSRITSEERGLHVAQKTTTVAPRP